MTDISQTHQATIHARRAHEAGLLHLVFTHFRDQVTLSDLTPEQMDDTGLNPIDIQAALRVSLWEKLADHLQVRRS